VPHQRPEEIRLPAAVWADPQVRQMCAEADGPALLKHITTHCGVTQGLLAYWMGDDSGYVSKTVNGKTGRIRDLERWRRIADAVNMPAANRVLVMGGDTTEPPAQESRESETTRGGVEPVRRREFISLAGSLPGLLMPMSLTGDRDAGPVETMEAIRREANALLSSASMTETYLTEWDDVIATHGRATRHAPVDQFLATLLADFAEIQHQMRQRQPTRVQIRLCRMAAHLAGMISLTLTKLGYHPAARRWARTAWLAAEESSDPEVGSWVRAQEAYAIFYGGANSFAVIEAAQLAQRPARRRPMVGAALAAALEARVHARDGDRRATEASIGAAEQFLAGLSAEQTGDSAFAYNESQLRYHQGNALTYLGDTDAAWKAQERALDLYPRADLDRTYIKLDRSSALAEAGDLAGAATNATAALLELPKEHRSGLVLDRARVLHIELSRLPGSPAAQLADLRNLIAEVPPTLASWQGPA
jgi:tetratricopeptide (TPR) repeat protein